jgi:hypothetical protein
MFTTSVHAEAHLPSKNSFAAFPEHAVFSLVAADLAAVVAGNPHSG